MYYRERFKACYSCLAEIGHKIDVRLKSAMYGSSSKIQSVISGSNRRDRHPGYRTVGESKEVLGGSNVC